MNEVFFFFYLMFRREESKLEDPPIPFPPITSQQSRLGSQGLNVGSPDPNCSPGYSEFMVCFPSDLALASLVSCSPTHIFRSKLPSLIKEIKISLELTPMF